MQAFEIPEFYMPYPARRNPHEESARAHAKEWAVRIGIVDDSGNGVWSERKFDAMDFAAFTARTYPDASAPELDLLTGWYVWAWYFDDHFLEAYTRQKDVAGGVDYVSRLAAYTPLSDTDSAPVPANPVEAGLSDLWARTVPARSVGWRERFALILQKHLTCTLREVLNNSQGWFPDPIEYVIEVRREAGGMQFAAALLEHSLGLEIPARIDEVRPIKVLRDTFADGVALRNDIISYPKEHAAGEINGVMVAERFLSCDLRRAVDVINELATSRMQQFENTVLSEVPLLVADAGLSPAEVLDLSRYIKGLQDWMAGDLEWAQQTDRYRVADTTGSPPPRQTSGPGAETIRLGLARRVAAAVRPPASADAAPVEVPDFYMPFPVRQNENLEAVRPKARAWAADMGMIGSWVPDWDVASFDARNLAGLAAMCFPDASPEKLEVAIDWFEWGLFNSDLFDEIFKKGRDLVGGKAYLDRQMTFVPISPHAIPMPTNPAERALADLWRRTAPVMSVDWRRWVRTWMRSLFDAYLWEVLKHIENRDPDPVDYVEMRRRFQGSDEAILLIHYVQGLTIAPNIYESRASCSLIDSFNAWQGLINDIFSYEKDRKSDHFVNGVAVFQRFLGCATQESVGVVRDLVDGQLRRFEHIAATELPALCEESGLDAAGRDEVDRYVLGVRDLFPAFLRGHQQSPRYADTTRPRTAQATTSAPSAYVLAGPTGLGTAGTRLSISAS